MRTKKIKFAFSISLEYLSFFINKFVYKIYKYNTNPINFFMKIECPTCGHKFLVQEPISHSTWVVSCPKCETHIFFRQNLER
jgi:ribosomal protein S27E